MTLPLAEVEEAPSPPPSQTRNARLRIRKRLTPVDRRRPTPPVESQNHRDRLARAGELRRTLRVGSLLVAVILVGTGVVLGARFPGRASLLFVVWTTVGVASLLVYFAAARAVPRLVVPLTLVFTILPAIGLLATASEPRALLGVTSGFTILPVAVPLFLAWTRALRTTWLIVYGLLVAVLILATGFGYLDATERIDLTTNLAIGALIGWVGGELLERLRERNAAQESELLRLNRMLSLRATTDSLTGLANRRQLDNDLEILTTSRTTKGGSYAFIMLDLDQFKRLNDDFGHAVGDEALRAVSAELQRVVRAGDTVYRYGGEEFLLIMPNASLADAGAAAERIRVAIAGLRIGIAPGTSATSLTISGGVAFSTLARERWETVLAAADRALYRAKETGRNRICVGPVANGGVGLLSREGLEPSTN